MRLCIVVFKNHMIENKVPSFSKFKHLQTHNLRLTTITYAKEWNG